MIFFYIVFSLSLSHLYNVCRCIQSSYVLLFQLLQVFHVILLSWITLFSLSFFLLLQPVPLSARNFHEIYASISISIPLNCQLSMQQQQQKQQQSCRIDHFWQEKSVCLSVRSVNLLKRRRRRRYYGLVSLKEIEQKDWKELSEDVASPDSKVFFT